VATVAFGYRAERLFLNSGFFEPLAIRDLRRFMTTGDGPA
jgi:hypothetical protein